MKAEKEQSQTDWQESEDKRWLLTFSLEAIEIICEWKHSAGKEFQGMKFLRYIPVWYVEMVTKGSCNQLR